MPSRVTKSPKATHTRKRPGGRRWSRRVNETSDALDLERGVFKLGDARQIASSLKRSAERSKRRKGTPYQSAMSMLNFYINRGGRGLGAREKARLERAKGELRALFGR
jgi:hypothetical protein